MVAALDWQRQRLVPLRRLELLPGKHPGRLSRLLAGRRLAGDRLGPEWALHLPHALARGGLLVGRRLWLVRKPFFLSLCLSLSLSLPLARSLARSLLPLAPCCHSLPAATRSLLPLAPCCHSANTRTLPPHVCSRNCSGSRALTSPLRTRYRVSTGAQIRNIRRSHHNLGTLTGDFLTNEKQKRKQKTAVILSALGLAAPNSPAAEVLTGTMARAAQSPPTRIRPTAVPARASTSAPGPASRSKAAATRSARPAQPAPPPRRLAPGPSTPTRAGPRAAERARAAEPPLPPPPRFRRLALQACWRQVQHRRRRGMDQRPTD